MNRSPSSRVPPLPVRGVLPAVALVVLAACSSAGHEDLGTSGAPEATASVASALVGPVDLRADVNRDGVVDWSDPADETDEETWDKDHGAVFLANLDDDGHRCPVTGTDDQLAACNDASDDVVNGADDALDLAPLRLRPWPSAPVGAVGRVTVVAPGVSSAADKVRLFRKIGGSYALFDWSTASLTLADLRGGVDLAVEGKDVVRDGTSWTGFVDVTVTARDGGGATLAKDVVRLRVAPVVTTHHLMTPERVYATNVNSAGSRAFMANLNTAAAAAGLPAVVDVATSDQWVQDFFEPATMTMPAAGGALHVMQVNLRSANYTRGRLRAAGRVIFTKLRGTDVGALQVYDPTHSDGMDSLNSFGNLETVPPHSAGGKTYPLGRILRGSISSYHPDDAFDGMLRAQGVQPMITVDTSWLLVGHVDETLSFLPSTVNPRGWVLLAGDPRLGLSMLRTLSQTHGAATMFEGKEWQRGVSAEVSVDDVLADADVLASSQEAAVAIDDQVRILTQTVGLVPADIVRAPVLHHGTGGYSVAFQPGMVNGISLGDVFGAPDPHGPSINGEDPFKEAFVGAVQPHGIDVRWVEDWDMYHRLDGEVHCGSNTRRAVLPSAKWWSAF